MKRFIKLIILITCLVSICACAKKHNGISQESSALNTGTSISSGQSSGNLSSSSASSVSDILSSSSSSSLSPVDYECPVFEDITEFNELFKTQYRSYPCSDLESNDLWMPPFDNEISIDTAYDGQVVSNEKAWTCCYIIDKTHPSFAYVSFQPELTFMRQIDQDCCYAVYNAEGGGRIFLFYKAEDYSLKAGSTAYASYLKIYVTDKLSYTDFSSVNAGDSLDKVIAIDRSAEFLKKNFSLRPQFTKTFHLLTDGVLIISYENLNGSLVVAKMEYRPDFSIVIHDTAYTVKILPQDYPQ